MGLVGGGGWIGVGLIWVCVVRDNCSLGWVGVVVGFGWDGLGVGCVWVGSGLIWCGVGLGLGCGLLW